MLPLVFTGAGDNTGFGDGTSLHISMLNTDVYKVLDLSFSERVVIKRGILCFDSAPFGAFFDCHVLYDGSIVHSYAKKFCIFGTGYIELDTGEESFIEQGLEMRFEVYNSTGIGIYDPPSDFKVWGNLLIRRGVTV